MFAPILPKPIIPICIALAPVTEIFGFANSDSSHAAAKHRKHVACQPAGFAMLAKNEDLFEIANKPD
jgi:hypothetical protein